MSDIRCPNCNNPLSLSDLANDWCENCGKKIPAFIRAEAPSSPSPASVEREPAPSPTRLNSSDDYESRPSGKPFDAKKLMAVLVLLAFGLVIAGGVLYFLLGPDTRVHVDNGGKEPITVLMDGAEKVTVPPGTSRSFGVRSGPHQFIARRGDKAVFEETKTISSDKQYVLNPESTSRYATIRFDYGGMSFDTYTDEESHKSLLMRSITLAPVGPWIEMTADDVFEKAPHAVKAKYSDSRTVLVKLPISDYDRLKSKSGSVSEFEAFVKRVKSSWVE